MSNPLRATPPKPAARPKTSRRGYTGAPRDPDRTVQAILAAATTEFAQKGIGGARVDAIAEQAGINKRMLYHYFGDKNGLYVAVLEAAYVKIRSAERDLPFDLADPEGAIRLLTNFTFSYFIEHPEFLGLLAAENLQHAATLKTSKSIAAINSTFFRTIGDIVKAGEDKGLFRAGLEPVRIYITIASLAGFYFSNRWTLSTAFDRDLTSPARIADWKQHMSDVLLAYVRNPA